MNGNVVRGLRSHTVCARASTFLRTPWKAGLEARPQRISTSFALENGSNRPLYVNHLSLRNPSNQRSSSSPVVRSPALKFRSLPPPSASSTCRLHLESRPSQVGINFARSAFESPARIQRRHLHGSIVRRKDLKGQSKLEAEANRQIDKKKVQEGASHNADPSKDANANFSNIAGAGLRDRLPQMPHIHRPSREELLAAATGFWSRMKVRFKWFSIRSTRPFNIDEISAFFSWFLLGHVLWVILGTTTFFSLAILAVNTVFAQETLARWVGNYLTKSSGIKIVFESAIVPKWGSGVITFKNVFVSRRPGQGKARVSKGSPETEAAAAAAAAQFDKSNPDYDEAEEEDTNYTQFDVSLDTVNVTLSFRKWFNGKGLLRDVEIQGVRGVIDRTSVHYTGEYIDPRSYKHEHNPGDFEIDSFKMQDLLVTVHQPNSFRPFPVAIFSCDLPQLRRQWLFYDFLSANTMSGTIDDSMFSIHPRQDHSFVSTNFVGDRDLQESTKAWKKHSRLRIDALNIDHLNRGVDGPFGWIHEGNVDIVADIMFPADDDESLTKLMSDFYDRMETTLSSRLRKPDASLAGVDSESTEGTKRYLVMDLRVHLNDVRAAVPLFTKDLSYVNNALVRPIVAYMNSRSTFIPIHCRVVKRASEFDGSWTIFDSGLMDDLSAEVRCHAL